MSSIPAGAAELRPRHAEATVRQALHEARVVVVNGPRQAGKTTLSRLLQPALNASSVSLDSQQLLEACVADPAGFLDAYPKPLFIDEFQRGGDPLVRAIKLQVDRDPTRGQYLLSGSSRFLTLRTISESLAGRVRIVDLWPYMQGEADELGPGSDLLLYHLLDRDSIEIMTSPPNPSLSTLLSQTLVAFNIELDNEAEHRMAHRTSRHPSGKDSGPWLVSAVMWSNCLRFLGHDSMTVRELENLARTPTNLGGMQRWGYIEIDRSEAAGAKKTSRLTWRVRATAKGRVAAAIWQPLFGIVEERWEDRFGRPEIARLRRSLELVTGRSEADLPDVLPILRYGLQNKLIEVKDPDKVSATNETVPHGPDPAAPLSLFALLSRALLTFALEFERQSDLSLAIGANVLRVLDEPDVRLRDVPVLSGVSKEAVSMAMGILTAGKCVETSRVDAPTRTVIARPTTKGREAQLLYRRTLAAVEEDWRNKFSGENIETLREILAGIAGDGTPAGSPLFKGLEPYPDGWRASVRRPATLPHFPMVLHRGGFPDGA